MHGLNYDISMVIMGKPISEAKNYLEESSFKEEKILTWSDDPEPISVKCKPDNRLNDIRNIEYCYSMDGAFVFESISVKNVNIKGESAFLPSSLITFLKQSCDHLGVSPDAETQRTTTDKINYCVAPSFRISHRELALEYIILKFVSLITEKLLYTVPQRNNFEVKELTIKKPDKYKYRILQNTEKQNLGLSFGIEPSMMPTLLRRQMITGEDDALCPFCQYQPTYIPIKENSTMVYLTHILTYHQILGNEFLRPKIPKVVVRIVDHFEQDCKMKQVLNFWLICPYQLCKGETYLLAAKLDFNGVNQDLQSQLNVDKILLEYNRHYLDCHFRQKVGQQQQQQKGEEKKEEELLPSHSAVAAADA